MNTQSKGDRSRPAKHPSMDKLVSHKKWSFDFLDVKSQNAHTYLDLVQTGPYIGNLGAVIGLVTSLRFMEITEFKHNFLNSYVNHNR